MPATLHCNALLFDLDGTLIDSYVGANQAWTVWAKRSGLDVDVVLGMIHGRQRPETVRAMRPMLTEEEVQAEAEHIRLMERDLAHTTVALSGSLELLTSLPADAWAIVTAADREVAEARLSAAGLPVPKVLVNADDLRYGKPDPQGYLMGARLLGVDPADAIVLEDAPIGLQAARAAGMGSIGLRFSHDDDELHLADVVTNGPASIQASVHGARLTLTID